MIGAIVKHKNSMDVCYYLHRHEESDYMCDIMNQGYTESWFLGQKCLITKEQLANGDWLKFDGPSGNCLRYGNWSQISG